MVKEKIQKGFTLIELLIMIAVIVLLSALAVTSLNNTRKSTRDAKRISDVQQIRAALDKYYGENKDYPTFSGNLGYSDGLQQCLVNTSNGFEYGSDCNLESSEVIMALVPSDPGSFFYRYTHAGVIEYELRFRLERSTAGFPAKTDLCANTVGISVCP